jgi:aminoglycoside phosphotransferase (APT) family kinase protein
MSSSGRTGAERFSPGQAGEMVLQDLDDFGGLLNWVYLQEWLQTQDLPGRGPVTAVVKLAGGSQNNLFVLHRGEFRFILRRPPKHLRANSNQTMLREGRVLRALAGSDVPHAHLYAVCEDESVIGACFYLMEPLEGFSPFRLLPGQYATDSSWRRDMSADMVRAGAALGAVDYQARGLSDYGKPENWHARQVGRWRSQLEGYRALDGYSGHALPFVDELGQWLDDNVPTDGRIGIIHGDFQYPNVMYRHDAPKITGLIDWELSTLGDPLLDLGWMLSSWTDADDPKGKEPIVSPWNGFLSRMELVRLYGELSGRDMAAMPWYFTLACFKLACLLEGTYARACAGQASREIGDRQHRYALWLLAMGMQVKEKGTI